MATSYRAIYCSLFFIICLIWLLLTHEYAHPPYPRINARVQPAEHHDYVLQPGNDICNTDSSLILLVYIHSAIENRHRRESIRSTWASRSIFGEHIRVIFILGSTHSVQLMKQAQFEFDTYRDIVQGTFIDTYRNLTYKGKV
jgi:hypothetical protein